jgi:hypothetical protein
MAAAAAAALQTALLAGVCLYWRKAPRAEPEFPVAVVVVVVQAQRVRRRLELRAVAAARVLLTGLQARRLLMRVAGLEHQPQTAPRALAAAVRQEPQEQPILAAVAVVGLQVLPLVQAAVAES